MRPSRLSIAKPQIAKAFTALPSRVLHEKDIGTLFDVHRKAWGLAARTTLRMFIEFLIEHLHTHRVQLNMPHRTITAYVWGEVSPYALAVGARPKSYLSHHTAMHFHGLTSQPPQAIFVNWEQSRGSEPDGELEQAAVDAAFQKTQRLTTNICEVGDHRLCLLNGKSTGCEGVLDTTDEFGQPLSVTGIERTLIDATVRPAYSGGVANVLDAFRRAAGKLSPSRMKAMLRRLAFVYPYEQAIGFYLERSGTYSPIDLKHFQRRRFQLDFYLDYAMQDPAYSRKWKLYYPRSMDD